ncbi:MAG: hypothetical protein KatS3mg110_3140 [Pirellulaceae bacterium]|nr:MAG: hypothetical protein KatS3mg110_3140 [Pirellulaceae bacterium]
MRVAIVCESDEDHEILAALCAQIRPNLPMVFTKPRFLASGVNKVLKLFPKCLYWAQRCYAGEVIYVLEALRGTAVPAAKSSTAVPAVWVTHDAGSHRCIARAAQPSLPSDGSVNSSRARRPCHVPLPIFHSSRATAQCRPRKAGWNRLRCACWSTSVAGRPAKKPAARPPPDDRSVEPADRFQTRSP